MVYVCDGNYLMQFLLFMNERVVVVLGVAVVGRRLKLREVKEGLAVAVIRLASRWGSPQKYAVQ